MSVPANAIATPAANISLAPMMRITDRHFRYLFRLLSTTALLYTEMVTAATIVHSNNLPRWLDYHPNNHPVALQLGGSDPALLAQATEIANAWQYDEINLNIGCPSDRVQSGQFGACLMRQPKQVAACVQAMQAASDCEITVKTRIGVDHDDGYDFLKTFVATVADAGCRTFIVHARKAWLKGLNPKQNRQIPALDYRRVWRLKQDFPDLTVIINGGLDDVDTVRTQLQHCDGVMIGRKFHQHPLWLNELESGLGLSSEPVDLQGVVATYWEYAQKQLALGVRWSILVQPLYGLAWGTPGAKRWRQLLNGPKVQLEKLLSVFEA